MKKRELLVFAGQSNMLGAAVYPPRTPVETKDSFEYLYRDVYLGCGEGRFREAGFPCGEFLYCDPAKAYPDGVSPDVKSKLADHRENIFFGASMSNLKDEAERSTHPFAVYSESNFVPSPSLAPWFAAEWEKRGHACAYAHIAKGAVSILHFCDEEMLRDYHRLLTEKCRASSRPVPAPRELTDMQRGAAKCFAQKAAAFLRDSEKQFPGEDLSTRCFVWLQGESDAAMDKDEYQTLLEVLWKKVQTLGFTHFLCIRVGLWGDPHIIEVIRAQEAFCACTPEAVMLTRACSLMPLARQPEGWFVQEPGEEYQFCRDSHYGFDNQHFNEKAFLLVAQRAAENMDRLLYRHEAPVLEEELLTGML